MAALSSSFTIINLFSVISFHMNEKSKKKKVLKLGLMAVIKRTGLSIYLKCELFLQKDIF